MKEIEYIIWQPHHYLSCWNVDISIPDIFIGLGKVTTKYVEKYESNYSEGCQKESKVNTAPI